MKMNNLYTYALVSTLYEDKKDYIDCFLPFVVSVIDEKPISEQKIQETINTEYGMLIPTHTLKTIAKRGGRQGYIQNHKDGMFLTEKGNELKDKIVSCRETEREINEFIEEFRKFLKEEREKDIEYKIVKGDVDVYFDKNIESLRYFLKERVDIEHLSDTTDVQHSSLGDFVAFIEKIENSNSKLYKILESIVYGKIISLAISGTDNISEMGTRFEKTKLFLDSNVIFDMLGLQGDTAERITKESIELIKNEACFSFFVFGFTVNEICSVLSAYPQFQKNYIAGIEVDNIYYYMKQRGWTAAKVAEYLADIENQLLELGISIYDIKNADENSFSVPKHLGLLSKYKPDQCQKGKEHDVLAVEAIRKLRGKKVRKVNHAKYFFLSQDNNLCKYSYHELDHKQNQTIPEVILESTLTNLLWLREPKKIPLSTIISFNKHNAIVSSNVWSKFQSIISESKAKDNSIYNDTTYLVSYKMLQSTLADIPEDSEEEDILNAIKVKAEEIRKKGTIEKQEILSEQNYLKNQLSELAKNKYDEKEKLQAEILEKLNTMKEEIATKANKDADRWVNYIKLFLFLVLVISLLLIYFTKGKFFIETIVWFFTVFSGISTFLFNFNIKSFTDELQNKIKINLVKKRLSENGIDSLIELLKSQE